jgi:hypothetical protein
VPDESLLFRLGVRHTSNEEAEADETAIELLKGSTYAGRLAGAGLFLQAIAADADKLPHLIQPTFGEHVADAAQLLRLSDMLRTVPNLADERLDQIAALPLGTRTYLDPWSGAVELHQPEELVFVAPREKAPLMVIRLIPYTASRDDAPAKIGSR